MNDFYDRRIINLTQTNRITTLRVKLFSKKSGQIILLFNIIYRTFDGLNCKTIKIVFNLKFETYFMENFWNRNKKILYEHFSYLYFLFVSFHLPLCYSSSHDIILKKKFLFFITYYFQRPPFWPYHILTFNIT